MKTSSNVLQALKIETVYLVYNKGIYLCAVHEIKKDVWNISTDQNNLSGKGQLKIKFNGSFLYLSVFIGKPNTSGVYRFTYDVFPERDKKVTDALEFAFFQTLKSLEQKTSEWNRRKEERYDIGTDENKIEKIGFKTIEQNAVTELGATDCIVNNLSFSGAQITTYMNNFYKGMKLCLCLTFTNPIEQIPVMSIIRNCSLEKINSKQMLSKLSLKFEESPVEYNERLLKYIKEDEL